MNGNTTTEASKTGSLQAINKIVREALSVLPQDLQDTRARYFYEYLLSEAIHDLSPEQRELLTDSAAIYAQSAINLSARDKALASNAVVEQAVTGTNH